MLKVKKIVAILLCMIMIIGTLTACGKKNEPASNDTNNESSNTGDNADSSKGENYIGDYNFTFWSADTTAGQNDDGFKSPVSQKIKEITGVSISSEFAVGDPSDKLSLMAASGEYPDMIYALEYSNIVVGGGGFIPLDDLIDEYGPHIKEVYGDDLNHLRYSLDDPHIYFLGLPQINQTKFEPESGFELQHAVVEELGYPEIKTLQDYENAIKTYIDKHPEIDGKPTIGLSLLADDWRIKISVTNAAVFATGGPDDGEWYYNKDTGKAQLHITRPEEREYFRWLNHMNDIGLLDPESFVQKYDQYMAKLAEGRVLGIIDSKWEYSDAESALVASGMPERTYGMYPVQVDDTTMNKDFRQTCYTGGYGVGITTSCEDPVAAIKFLDWMCTDEAQVLFRWGIEGVHYDVVDGKRQFKPDVFEAWKEDPNFTVDTGIGIYSWPWPGYGDGAIDKNGDYYGPISLDSIVETYNDAEKKTLEAYGAKLWKDLYPSENDIEPSDYGVLWELNIPSDSEANIIMQTYDEITAKCCAKAVLCSPDEFDTVWDEFMQELKDAGIDRLEDEFNQLLENQMTLWSQSGE